MVTHGRLVTLIVTAVGACTAVALGGCGASSAPASKASSAPASNGEAAKPAAQILTDAAAALKNVRSLKAQGALMVAKQHTAVSVALEPPVTASVSFATGSASAAVLLVKGAGYLKASATFYEQRGTSKKEATLIANRWIRVPGAELGAASLTKGLDPPTLSRCLVENHGTLSVAGKTTVNGRPAVVVLDKGDRPGSTPSKLYVATTGAPLPLRAIATGAQRPGGSRDSTCNGTSGTSQSGDELTFSDYNEPLNISPPTGVTNLTQEPAASLSSHPSQGD